MFAKIADSPDEIPYFINEINNEINQAASQRQNILSPQVFGNKGTDQSIKHPDLQQMHGMLYSREETLYLMVEIYQT